MRPDEFSVPVIDALAPQLVSVSWGDLFPASWVRLASRSRHVSARLETVVTLIVDVQEHVVTSPSFRGKTVRLPALKVEEDVVVLDKGRAERGDTAILQTAFREAARKASYRLREHDPRIGEILEEGQTRNLLRRTVLFDPPRLRPPVWKGASGLDAASCPFCQDGFGRGYLAMWGGGNLLWVHPRCWLQANG